jgi:enoyl-CoA hydratase
MRIERVKDVAVVHMQAGKANAINTEFLASIESLFDAVEASDARSVVMIGYDRFFSAGLALPALIDLDRDRMRAVMLLFDRAMMRVFTSVLPVVAAVNGHAIAGGCVLALQCDVRLMAEGDFKIGLLEAQLGIGLPSSVFEPLRAQLPSSSLVPVALEGGMFSPVEAQRLGLVDALVPPDALFDRAVARAAELAKTPRQAYGQIKRAIRRAAIDAVKEHSEAERERWLDTWFSAEARQRLRDAVAKLR